MSDTNTNLPYHVVWKTIVPASIVIAFVALVVGVWLPLLRTDELLGDATTYSVVTGIRDLFGAGKPHLALLIVVFSVLFPAAKLVTLGVVWFRGPRLALGDRSIVALRVLSKWSMLDIFAVSLFVGTVQLGMLAHASARYGVYVFGGAILLAMIATYLVSWLLEHEDGRRMNGIGAEMPVVLLMLLPLAGTLLIGAVTRPLMEVEKWVFWKNTYSILAGTRELAARGDIVLAAGLGLFVIILPMLTLTGWTVLWFGSRVGKSLPGLTELTLVLDEWAMIDVFALAVLVVIARVGDSADVQPLTGMWLLAATGPLFIVLSWLGRRSVRA